MLPCTTPFLSRACRNSSTTSRTGLRPKSGCRELLVPIIIPFIIIRKPSCLIGAEPAFGGFLSSDPLQLRDWETVCFALGQVLPKRYALHRHAQVPIAQSAISPTLLRAVSSRSEYHRRYADVSSFAGLHPSSLAVDTTYESISLLTPHCIQSPVALGTARGSHSLC